MTKKILITGASGFIGRNVLPYLVERYNVSAPPRAELDLLDAGAVNLYLAQGKFDAVVHLATPTGHNPDDEAELFERSLRVFTSILHRRDLYGKLIYLGSGAEYGKHRHIVRIKEDEFGQELPRDSYGLSRCIMSELAAKCDNTVNLRLFACCGAGDPQHKLIPGILGNIRAGVPVELRRNVKFDYLYVCDIAPVLSYFIENDAKYAAYNLCSGTQALIVDIAGEVCRQMCSAAPVTFKQDGLGFEYTGDNSRLLAELPAWRPRTINEAIKEIIGIENR
jgi:GDP-L-fucose synthase